MTVFEATLTMLSSGCTRVSEDGMDVERMWAGVFPTVKRRFVTDLLRWKTRKEVIAENDILFIYLTSNARAFRKVNRVDKRYLSYL